MQEITKTQENKNEVGRPSEYTKENLVKAWDYLARYEQLGDVIPSIEGLAEHIGVSRKTLYNWSEDQEKVEFLHIFEMCMAKQGRTVLNKGLNGTFNPTISKLLLSKHGYVEKIENNNTHHFDEVDAEEKAKLDKILHGNQKPTTEQASDAAGDQRQPEGTQVSLQ